MRTRCWPYAATALVMLAVLASCSAILARHCEEDDVVLDGHRNFDLKDCTR